jgi:hypothetical protein
MANLDQLINQAWQAGGEKGIQGFKSLEDFRAGVTAMVNAIPPSPNPTTLAALLSAYQVGNTRERGAFPVVYQYFQ